MEPRYFQYVHYHKLYLRGKRLIFYFQYWRCVWIHTLFVLGFTTTSALRKLSSLLQTGIHNSLTFEVFRDNEEQQAAIRKLELYWQNYMKCTQPLPLISSYNILNTSLIYMNIFMLIISFSLFCLLLSHSLYLRIITPRNHDFKDIQT